MAQGVTLEIDQDLKRSWLFPCIFRKTSKIGPVQ